MLNTFVFYALPFTFTVLVACALTSLVSGLTLILFRVRITNQTLRHPYLSEHPWERYSVPIRAAILLDYFFRLCFPNSRFWIIGHANRLLAHVKPDDVSSRIKWPLIGFWGGCFGGLIAMAVLWTLILITMNV